MFCLKNSRKQLQEAKTDSNECSNQKKEIKEMCALCEEDPLTLTNQA